MSGYRFVWAPPSMSWREPVMKPASSEARKATRLAISSGVECPAERGVLDVVVDDAGEHGQHPR